MFDSQCFVGQRLTCIINNSEKLVFNSQSAQDKINGKDTKYLNTIHLSYCHYGQHKIENGDGSPITINLV